MGVKILGREPALWLGLIGALLTWLVSLGFDWLNAGQATAIVTFITGVVTAIVTRPFTPALFSGLVAAGAALFAEYGLHFSEAAVTGLGALIIAGFAVFAVRPQVSPVETVVTKA